MDNPPMAGHALRKQVSIFKNNIPLHAGWVEDKKLCAVFMWPKEESACLNMGFNFVFIPSI